MQNVRRESIPACFSARRSEKSFGVLRNELGLKDRRIEALKVKNKEELRKLANEGEKKTLKGLEKNSLLVNEIATFRMRHAE